MLARLSSKGQLVIPKAVREALGIRAGTEFYVELREGKIVLEPITASPVDALYGKYVGAGLLRDLEVEHQQELRREEALRP